MRIEEAIEVFGGGFTFTRSFTHPYHFERVDPLWVMRDAPRKRPEYRNEEWLVYRTPAPDAEAIIQANRRRRYAVCVFRPIDESEDRLKADWKGLGYRLCGTETLFTHDLDSIPTHRCSHALVQVTEMSGAEQLKAAAGHWQILPQELTQDPPRMRQYMALDGETPIGWVRSIHCGEFGWCSNMFVQPDYRRQGVGRALMAQMLGDDKRAGLTGAVLLASHVGSMLYPTVGYEAIGKLMIFNPPRA